MYVKCVKVNSDKQPEGRGLKSSVLNKTNKNKKLEN